MILSDKTLKSVISKGELVIDPYIEDHVQPGSIDCRLGSHFLLVDDHHTGILDLDSEINYREVDNNTIILPPRSFILATTMEYFELPNTITAFVEGRSSIGRMGLFIQNAGWVDAGFKGRITLELFNANSLPIKLEAGRRVCQMVFCQMDQAAEKPYAGKYQGQIKSVGSQIYKDKELSTQI